MAVPSLI
jgi:dienelactone hydrolase